MTGLSGSSMDTKWLCVELELSIAFRPNCKVQTVLLLCREGTDKDVLPLKAKTYKINAHVRDIFVTQLSPQLTSTCSSCRFSRLFREITKRGNACRFQTIMYYPNAFKFNSAEEISLHTLMIFFKTTVACRS